MNQDIERSYLRPPRPTSHWPLWLILGACAIGFVVLTRPTWLPSWLSGISPQPGSATRPGTDAGRQDRSATVPTNPQNGAAAPPARGDGTAVYRCARGGSVTYSSDAECAGGKAAMVSIDRSANIVRSTPVPAQQPGAEFAQNQPAAAFAAPANIGPRPRVESPECHVLDQIVLELDEAGRHPQSAYSQQRIRDERRRTRDRQFAIGC